MSILEDGAAPTPAPAVELYEGVARRLVADGVFVDLDGGGSVGPVPTSLTVAAGAWVLVAIGRRRTWIVEVQT